MSNGFIVSVNNQKVYECLETRFPARLRRHLDEIDLKLEQGIQLGENWVELPDDFQKQQYISMLLLNALDQQDAGLISVMSAYLVTRYSELCEIRAVQSGEFYSFSLLNK